MYNHPWPLIIPTYSLVDAMKAFAASKIDLLAVVMPISAVIIDMTVEPLPAYYRCGFLLVFLENG